MATQLSFDLPTKAAHGREDFYVSPSNAIAVGMIDAWENWSPRKLSLIGPNGSGKTHLTHVWAERANAAIINASDITGADIAALAKTNVAVEDVPTIAANTDAQTALFHLHNLALAEGQSLLFTATKPAQHWGLTLPDLKSRMEATHTANLQSPDDTLLSALLAKLFNDRQLIPHPDVIPYLTLRMDRSFDTARRIVTMMDKRALDQSRPLGRKLASEVLDKLDV